MKICDICEKECSNDNSSLFISSEDVNERVKIIDICNDCSLKLTDITILRNILVKGVENLPKLKKLLIKFTRSSLK